MSSTETAHEGRSARANAERRLGWMLCAPAVTVMLVVTAYPIAYAVWLLSLIHISEPTRPY